MQQLPLSRTRFGEEIVAEFIQPEVSTNKVIIFSAGCPGYPLGKDELMHKFSRLGYWTISYAYRGTWESGGTFLEYPPSDDILTIMDNLGSFEDSWSGTRHTIHTPEVYLIGGSFGGAATLLASRDPRVKKAITISSVTDWMDQQHTVEPLDFMNEYLPRAFGMAYRGEQEVYRKLTVGDFYNPTHEKKTIDGKKLLLIHAKGDRVVHALPAKAFATEVGAQFVMLDSDDHMGVGYAKEPRVYKHIEKFMKTK
ncbi:MAG TPA: prolyl oligopeptidase family serine peptidase [Candidatus Paceibacterota bacterium]|nr:prolyl oligopeptidase family serine peptidase [Candidatus Paceibacterota bacterium]